MPSFEISGPDGKKYQVDAPEGASQQDAIKFIAHQHYGITGEQKKDDFIDPLTGKPATSQPHYMDENVGAYGPLMHTLAGLGVGTQEFGRGLGNMVGLGHVFPSVFGDEHIAKEAELNRPVTDTTAGKIGEVGGQIAAGLPLSEAAAAASTAASTVPYVGRVLGNALTRSGVEGAAQSSILADPENRGEAAIEGGLTGGTLHGALASAGRVARGLVQKSGAAQDLTDLAESQGKKLHIPITQAADEEGDLISRSVGSVYSHGLPLIPGVSGQLKSQARVATGTLKQAFEDEYNQTVNAYQFNVPPNFKDEVAARIQAAMPNVDKTTLEKISQSAADHLDRYASGATDLDGGNLLNAKAALLKMGSNDVEKSAAKHGAEAFDDIIDRELTQGGSPQNLQDLARYQKLGVPDPQTGLSLPQSMQAVTKRPVTTPSTEGRLGMYALGGYSLFAHGGAGFIPAIIGANALATKTAQRFMMGDTWAQEAITNLLEKHPEMTRKVGQVLRLAGTSMVGDSQHEQPPGLPTSSNIGAAGQP